MMTNAVKRGPITSLSVAIATFGVAGLAIASRAVEDRAMALLHVGSSLVSSLPIGTGFSPAAAAAVALVLFLAGAVSGLSGFAFSAVAACILWLLPPLQAVPLVMLLSVCNQLLSVGALRREIVLRSTPEREGALAYIAGGLVGVPIGLGLLQSLPIRLFGGGLGLFLIIYSALVLLKPDGLRIRLSGWKPAAAVGAAGGVVGGFSAFPGSIPVVYLGLRGVSKTETHQHHPALHSSLAAYFAEYSGAHPFQHFQYAVLAALGAGAARSASRYVDRPYSLSAVQRGQFPPRGADPADDFRRQPNSQGADLSIGAAQVDEQISKDPNYERPPAGLYLSKRRPHRCDEGRVGDRREAPSRCHRLGSRRKDRQSHKR